MNRPARATPNPPPADFTEPPHPSHAAPAAPLAPPAPSAPAPPRAPPRPRRDPEPLRARHLRRPLRSRPPRHRHRLRRARPPHAPPLPRAAPRLPETATLADAFDAARADATAWVRTPAPTPALNASSTPSTPPSPGRKPPRHRPASPSHRPRRPPRHRARSRPWAALGIPLAAADPSPPSNAPPRRRPYSPELRPAVSPRPLASEELLRAPRSSASASRPATKFFTGFSTDISVSGIFVECARTLPVGRAVEVFFELPGGHSVSAEARVQRVRDGKDGRKPGLGIAFRALVREDRVRVGRYVAQQLTGKIPRV
ncbi:MAG: PilZ domain-containing protein [bacterium]